MLLLADDEALLAGRGHLEADDFLETLKKQYQDEYQPSEPEDADLPFRGGWFVYMGYEMAGAIEPVLSLPVNPARLPDAIA